MPLHTAMIGGVQVPGYRYVVYGRTRGSVSTHRNQAGGDRVRDDGADGGREHLDPDGGGRGQAGAGDGVLRDGVPGDRPVRQPTGRVAGGPGRAGGGGPRVRGAGTTRRADVRDPAAAAAAAR